MFGLGVPNGGAGSFLVIFLAGLLFGPPYVWYWLNSARNSHSVWKGLIYILLAGYSWTVLLLAIAAGWIG